ncbi:MAG: ABC transporter permease, partial [Paracoccaceae bacterium]
MNFSEQDKKGWKLLSLPFVFSLLLLAIPILTMFTLSFWTQDYLVLRKEFTLDNYKEAWFEPVYQKLFNRSLIISMTVTLLTISFAFPVAYFISFYGGRRKALWLFFITIPFWTSYLLRMFLWKVILGYNGVLNSFFKWLGVITEPLTFLLYNSNAVIIALTHGWAPFAILP